MTTTRIGFTARSGAKNGGVLAEPEGAGKAPAVVLLHEWWGVNAHVESLLERFAAEGFLAFAPDLFHGEIAKTADEAAKKMNGLDSARAVDEIAGAVAFVRAHVRGNGKVGVTGFCMGGALAFRAANGIAGLDAVVPFYGIPADVDYASVTAPISAHFAQHDGWAKPELAEKIRATLAARGRSMELHIYDAQHAFVNDTRPEVYDAKNAALALDRTYAFFKKQLA